MKILIFHHGIIKKNGWGRTFTFAKNLSFLGNEVVFVTSSTKKGFFCEKLMIDGVKIFAFKDIIPLKLLKMGFGFISFVNKIIFASIFKCDVVHTDSHRPAGYYPSLVNRFFSKSKFVIEWWDNFGYTGQLANKKKIFKLLLGLWEARTEISSKIKADGVVVLSDVMMHHAKEEGVLEDKIVKIHGGADIDNIKYYPLNTMKVEYGLENNLTLGFIGDGDAELGDLHPLFSVLKQINLDFNVKFVNYGKAFSQEVKNRYDINDVIYECGWIDYSLDSSLLAISDVFLLIKKNDNINPYGWPNKFGDYLATGRSVLLTPYGDLVDFIEEFKPSVFVSCYNELDIYESVKAIVNKKGELEFLGMINREISEKVCSWMEKTKQLNDFYNLI